MKSYSNEAKKIIRSYMSSCRPSTEYGSLGKFCDSEFRSIARDNRSIAGNPLRLGEECVDQCDFDVYSDNMNKMLYPIYGKTKVDSWDFSKRYDVARHLIARECVSVVKEYRSAKSVK